MYDLRLQFDFEDFFALHQTYVLGGVLVTSFILPFAKATHSSRIKPTKSQITPSTPRFSLCADAMSECPKDTIHDT